MKVQLTNDQGDTLTMERNSDGTGDLVIRFQGDATIREFIVEHPERVKLAEMVEAL